MVTMRATLKTATAVGAGLITLAIILLVVVGGSSSSGVGGGDGGGEVPA